MARDPCSEEAEAEQVEAATEQVRARPPVLHCVPMSHPPSVLTVPSSLSCCAMQTTEVTPAPVLLNYADAKEQVIAAATKGIKTPGSPGVATPEKAAPQVTPTPTHTHIHRRQKQHTHKHTYGFHRDSAKTRYESPEEGARWHWTMPTRGRPPDHTEAV